MTGASSARARARRFRDFLSDLRRRGGRYPGGRGNRFPPPARREGDGYRGAAAWSVRLLAISAAGAVEAFAEKPQGDGSWINGGFFVLEPSVFDLIADDATVWEKAPLEALAKQRQLHAFRHQGFWLPMDTLRDKAQLDNLWASGAAPWKVW